jgi:site-specific recombinase XerC
MRMLPSLGINTSSYSAASVKGVVLDQIRGCRPAHAKTIVRALRLYLRFLATTDACRPGLDHMVPTVAEWRLSSLPKYLDARQAACLMDSCVKNGPQGFRGRAIVLLLLRLGLRAGDISNMRPTDIDWQSGKLLVRGRGRRDVRLPLPQDAGDAILDYVDSARPPVAIDRVFLCLNARFGLSGLDSLFLALSSCATACWDNEFAIPRRKPPPAHIMQRSTLPHLNRLPSHGRRRAEYEKRC